MLAESRKRLVLYPDEAVTAVGSVTRSTAVFREKPPKLAKTIKISKSTNSHTNHQNQLHNATLRILRDIVGYIE
jgi:hypothetical protein